MTDAIDRTPDAEAEEENGGLDEAIHEARVQIARLGQIAIGKTSEMRIVAILTGLVLGACSITVGFVILAGVGATPPLSRDASECLVIAPAMIALVAIWMSATMLLDANEKRTRVLAEKAGLETALANAEEERLTEGA